MQLLPEWYVFTMVFVFGLIIGSFLNVIIYRLHTGKSLNDRSHCLSCGTQLTWYQLVPVVSYILLRGRCAACSAYIPLRYLLVELLTGLLFLAVYLHFTDLFLRLLFAVVMSILVVCVVYDLYHFIIPDETVITLVGVALIVVGYTAWQTGDVSVLWMSALAGMSASGALGLLWAVSKGRWIGFGDVKLALPLGALLGLSGVFSFLVLSFWVGACVSVLLLGVQYGYGRWRISWGKNRLRFFKRPITMKSEVPFAPFLVGGFLLVLFCNIDVLSVTTYVLSHVLTI